jgi:TM2 domain-containing membrane protein YozV
MRRIFFPILILAILIPTFAESQPVPASPTGVVVRSGALGIELELIAAELGDRKLGDLTGPDLVAIGQKIALVRRERALIHGAAMLSFIVPGAGQFAVGNPGGGAAFLLGQIALTAGTVAGALYLLPADLRPGTFDYFNSSRTAIKNAFDAHSRTDLIPAMAVMMAGMVLDVPLHIFAARGAARDARDALESGKIKLEGRFGPGFVGMGAKL